MKHLTVFFCIAIFSLTEANLITNGDFELGNVGFSTDYTFTGAGALHPDQTYTIITNPNLVHPGATSYGDHTTGSGNMMAINGAANVNAVVWSQNVTLEQNTDYEFSIAVSSWTSSNVADLQFSLQSGGLNLGTIVAPSTSGVWSEHKLNFNSGSLSGLVSLSFNDFDGNYGGNDFAIDDLSLVKTSNVPEPASVSLLLCGLTILGLFIGRKK